MPSTLLTPPIVLKRKEKLCEDKKWHFFHWNSFAVKAVDVIHVESVSVIWTSLY